MATSKAAKIPSLLYGTAWKKEQTQDLVRQALISGFRGVDTAAQPKHYQEHLVGAGIRSALETNSLTRKDLYLQTKFTSIQGQDPNRMPYNPKSSITDQVHASISSSLKNLSHTSNPQDSYLDCVILHSPLPTLEQTTEAWSALESHVPHRVRTLGLSNTYSLPLLQTLFDAAKIKPSVLQNRFYADAGYDAEIRAFCKENRIRYQSFWTLTANPHLLASEPVQALAAAVGVGRPVALYGLVIGLGEVSVLNGTTNAERMKEDLDGVEKIARWRSEKADEYVPLQKAFEELLV